MQDRINETEYNYQNCLMKIIKYNNNKDIVVEFQDEYKAKVHTTYGHFTNGNVKNPYYPSVYGVGIIGDKCLISIDGKHIKEYSAWKKILERCYYEKYKEKHTTYKNATCCDEWLLYENFYKWLHEQENFDKWLNGDRWNIDKDILIKGNKVYSPTTCCLVPNNVNKLFTKCDVARGNYPIGVSEQDGKLKSCCHNPFTNKMEFLGYHSTEENSFNAYKKYKENIIKQVAKIEYEANNITKQCYEAMMDYEVEITD